MKTIQAIANLDKNQEIIKDFIIDGFKEHADGDEYYYNLPWNTCYDTGEAVEEKEQVQNMKGKQYFDLVFENCFTTSSQEEITTLLINKAIEQNENDKSFQEIFNDIKKIIAFIQDEENDYYAALEDERRTKNKIY